MAGDALFDHVSLLLHGDGPNGSTSFVDSSPTPKLVSAYGNAAISTAQSKFGGSSIALDGSGDYLTVPASSAWNFGTGDFTAEAFVRVNSLPAIGYLLGDVMWAGGYRGGWYLATLSNGALSFCWGGSSGAWYTVDSAAGVVTTGAFHHIAAVRVSGTQKVFFDGAEVISFANAASYDGGRAFHVGANLVDGSHRDFSNCYIDDVRVTKGVARYSAGFTPPASAFPDCVSLISGNVRDSAGAGAARTVRAYRRDTGDMVGSAVSDASTGDYSINSRHSGSHTLVFLPASGESLNALVLDNVTGV